jgi:hypothetical protein
MSQLGRTGYRPARTGAVDGGEVTEACEQPVNIVWSTCEAAYSVLDPGGKIKWFAKGLFGLWLTTLSPVGIISNMDAIELLRTRIVYSENAFAELVLWRVPTPVRGSAHDFKYRLAYVVDQVCVVRYDNEAGKGDHRHFGNTESDYTFQSVEALIADFQQDITRWDNENRNP